MFGEPKTTMMSPQSSSQETNLDLFKLGWETVKGGELTAPPVPRHVPSVPMDVSDEDEDDSGEDDSPTSANHPRSSIQRQPWVTTKEHDATSSPLTELIRAFEMLKSSPFLGDLSETNYVDERQFAQEKDIQQQHVAASAGSGGSLVRRRHSEYALQYGVIVVPTSAMQHDAMHVRSASWEKNLMAGTRARPRAMTGPLEPGDGATRDKSASTATQQVPTPEMQPAPAPASSASVSMVRRPEGFRARRPALLRIETNGKSQVPRLPQRRRKAAHIGGAPPRSVSNPAISAIQRDIRFLPAVTKDEWDALHAGAEMGMALKSCVQTSMVPSSCVFPPSLMSCNDDEADRQPPTTAELHAAIDPYPMDTPSKQDRNRRLLVPDRNIVGQVIHSREPADHSVQAWTLKTFNALQRTDSKLLRRPPPLRSTSLQIRRNASVQFVNQPQVVAERESVDVQCNEATDSDQPREGHDALVNSPSYADAFIFEQNDRPSLQSGCLSGVSLQRVRSNALASDSSASEFGEILTAPPALGRGWHRGRRNAMCATTSVAPLSYRPVPGFIRRPDGIVRDETLGDGAEQTDEENKKRRRMSASAAMTTFRSVIASWSRRTGSHQRFPSHPWKSPYPRSAGVMASTALQGDESDGMHDAALHSPYHRRPSTARGVRGDCFSRIASMPPGMMDKGALWEASRREKSLHGIGSILSPSKRTAGNGARCSSVSYVREADGRHSMEIGLPRLPQRKKATPERAMPTRSASYGLGLHYTSTNASRVNGVPFPSSPLS